MTEPFLGEIQAFGFGFWPTGWLPCDGRVVPLQQFATLYALIGTTYGGNGTTNFALPNLVGCVAMSQGQGPGLGLRSIGERVGEATVTMISDELPLHSHNLQLGDHSSQNGVAAPLPGGVMIDPGFNGFVPPPPVTTLDPRTVSVAGQSQPHPNTQPTLAMIYCIAVQGIYPQFQ